MIAFLPQVHLNLNTSKSYVCHTKLVPTRSRPLPLISPPCCAQADSKTSPLQTGEIQRERLTVSSLGPTCSLLQSRSVLESLVEWLSTKQQMHIKYRNPEMLLMLYINYIKLLSLIIKCKRKHQRSSSESSTRVLKAVLVG